MRVHGTRVAQACTERSCRSWTVLDVERLISQHGEDYLLWDRRTPCRHCEGRTHYMASPGPSTPFRPLLSGQVADHVRKDFLRSFGFTKRDVRRIQALAESADYGAMPAALDDLDVPFKVQAVMPGFETRSTGKYLGEWGGRVLLWWDMNEREAEAWRRSRASGPKSVPSPSRRSLP